jgi:hypothetical protein
MLRIRASLTWRIDETFDQLKHATLLCVEKEIGWQIVLSADRLRIWEKGWWGGVAEQLS